MQIYVCVKHVPDTAASIKVVEPAAFDESVKFVVNPYDEYGLEEALRIVSKTGGEVVIVTVGKASAVNTTRTALAVGASRGILVKTDAQFLDAGLTARALQKAIQQDGAPDLVLSPGGLLYGTDQASTTTRAALRNAARPRGGRGAARGAAFRNELGAKTSLAARTGD